MGALMLPQGDEAQNPLAGHRRLVIKIGSALLVDDKSGKLRTEWLAALASDIAALKAEGRDMVIVSSGAIALGRRILGLPGKTLPLDQSQAAASAGQIALSQAWASHLGQHVITTGQILLTPNITEERRYFLNARTTVNTLLGLGAVPIINENDSVATFEIRYGDNDRLSARVATMIEADMLVLLSDIDGLYTAPPAQNPDARHIPHVAEITPEIEAMAGGAASHLSRGGMTTKLGAGKIAASAGTAMIIAQGTGLNPLRGLTQGGRHTLFAPATNATAARKRWIMGTLEVTGQITIDDGAVRALKSGRSLLPIGVVKLRGDFVRGDVVAVRDLADREIARGLVGLDRDAADLVIGKKSETIKDMLGPSTRTELVHRDNLVLLSQ
ncbi:glutamate 5-kinase [Pelagibacterium halotolerans]|uniref:Glutamate 5-kinase n=1 Tax=Pelagibacterium halotolerans (strain DSM 22347 / JCM 15775 / CGMCC 1.7692 / B2) TaxID=1082931 RepID=G4RH02_PELHB|nr:glutamate 5-kinase [Pelagibacterium halotolerans]AEQ53154.1 glutamate 5-kinase [Pelagibacterium halotolerans B2]